MTSTEYTEGSQNHATLRDALKEMDDRHIACRDMRHAWDVKENFHARPDGTIMRTLTCLRCDSERVEMYERTSYGLEKITQHYTYPEGYQIKGVPRGVKPRAVLQREQYRRAMSEVAEVARAQAPMTTLTQGRLEIAP